MRTLFFILFLGLATLTYAQKKVSPSPKHQSTAVYIKPEFPGGEAALKAFFSGNLHYPPAAIEAHVMGRVIVRFFVNEQGKISDALVIRGIGTGCDEEALRLVKAMPDWKPGSFNGNTVGGLFSLPVYFNIQ